MFCKNCGAQIEDGSVSCEKCGNGIASPDDNYNQQSAVLLPKKKINLYLLFVCITAGISIVVAIVKFVLWINGTFLSGNIYVDRYNDYSMSISKIADDEEYIADKYQAMFDDNLDDYDIYTTLRDDIIPKAKDFMEKLEEISPKDKELRKIHNIWIDAWNMQYGAFTLILSAVENSDSAQATEANDRLDMAKKLFRDFKDALEDYRVKHGLELVGTMS